MLQGTVVPLCLSTTVLVTLQVRSLRANVVALEVASGEAERRLQVAEEAAAATRQQLQEAEEQVHTLALADAMLSLFKDAA